VTVKTTHDGATNPESAGAQERIPFNRPSIQGHEIDFIRSAVEEGVTSADGPFSTKVNDLLRAEIGARDVLLTTSCTAALEMSALLLATARRLRRPSCRPRTRP